MSGADGNVDDDLGDQSGGEKVGYELRIPK
jgi:hypothetical protein